MEVHNVLDEKIWEKFVIRQPHVTFLQSWAWGEFQESLGNSHFRLGAFEGERLVGVASAILTHRRLGRFIYVPHGPLVQQNGPASGGGKGRDAAVTLLGRLVELAREEEVNYLRVEPRWVTGQGGENLLMASGFRRAPSSVQAKRGWLLDLYPKEEELLANMRKTTRYLVRKARDIGVEVSRTRSKEDLPLFHKLMSATAERQRFTTHLPRYLQKQFEILASREIAELFLAKYRGEVLAAAIFISYGDTTSYVHSASSHSSVPGAYLLIWEAIRAARKKGLDIFDFWGIAERDDRNHPWYGLSLFKRGFGGYTLDYVGAWDYPLNPRYLSVLAVEKARKILRRV